MAEDAEGPADAMWGVGAGIWRSAPPIDKRPVRTLIERGYTKRSRNLVLSASSYKFALQGWNRGVIPGFVAMRRH